MNNTPISALYQQQASHEEIMAHIQREADQASDYRSGFDLYKSLVAEYDGLRSNAARNSLRARAAAGEFRRLMVRD